MWRYVINDYTFFAFKTHKQKFGESYFLNTAYNLYGFFCLHVWAKYGILTTEGFNRNANIIRLVLFLWY